VLEASFRLQVGSGEIVVKPGGRVERTIKWKDGKPQF